MHTTLLAISRPTEELVNWCVPWAENPEDLAEFAGRVCYNSVDKFGNNTKYLQKLIGKGHESVIEHISASFYITGISRSCLAQATRHRLFSYSVMSQRFVDQSNFETVVPKSIWENEEKLELFTETVETLKHAYNNLRVLGCKKEDARFLLPEATCTNLVMTGNMRSWRHFIEMRCNKDAQWEIRNLATDILCKLYKECPNIFEDLYKKFIVIEEVND